MPTTIPADNIVEVTPSVLQAGGQALDCTGLVLTNSVQVPIGTIMSFANESDVQTFFGGASAEAAAASIYFAGFIGANRLPAAMKFAQYPSVAVSAYLRGASISDLSLTQVKALSGTLTITGNGTPNTSAAIDLSGATSFSDAATIIQAAFTTPNFSVTWDAVALAFKFTTTLTGATATMIFATGTGTIIDGLRLTAVLGAVTSQGADAATPAAFMDDIIILDRNWVTFSTLFDPDSSGHDNKLAFATWCGQQSNKFAYCCWDVDATPKTTVPATSSLGYAISQAAIGGTCLIYSPDYSKAVFVQGFGASLDFTQLEGRTTLAFRGQSGIAADVHDESTAENLKANGYNFYGDYATAKQDFIWFYPGKISGQFAWVDSYLNQIVLNASLQRAGMNLFANARSIPYNQAGYDLISAALRDPINEALNFGTIRRGVPLSEFQKQAANNGAGLNIDNVLSTVGWYLRVFPASAAVRADRGSPQVTLWYMDGQSVQKLTVGSIQIQ